MWKADEVLTVANMLDELGVDKQKVAAGEEEHKAKVAGAEAAAAGEQLIEELKKAGLGDDAAEVEKIMKAADDVGHGTLSDEDLDKAIDNTKAEIAKLKAEGHPEEAEKLQKILDTLEEAKVRTPYGTLPSLTLHSIAGLETETTRGGSCSRCCRG